MNRDHNLNGTPIPNCLEGSRFAEPPAPDIRDPPYLQLLTSFGLEARQATGRHPAIARRLAEGWKMIRTNEAALTQWRAAAAGR
jgi:hypothetical protein